MKLSNSITHEQISISEKSDSENKITSDTRKDRNIMDVLYNKAINNSKKINLKFTRKDVEILLENAKDSSELSEDDEEFFRNM